MLYFFVMLLSARVQQFSAETTHHTLICGKSKLLFSTHLQTNHRKSRPDVHRGKGRRRRPRRPSNQRITTFRGKWGSRRKHAWVWLPNGYKILQCL